MVTPDHRLAGGERDAARGRKPDPQPVKLPGPVVTAIRSSAAKATRHLHDARDQRHQRFGMATLIGCDSCAITVARGVEHGGGAGVKRGIDGEDQHGES